ncbi:MAG: bacteriorhodopsin-like [Deinococcota bacterium]
MDLPVLTQGQFDLVYQGFSFAIACMGASAIFFLMARTQVSEKYRPALIVSALVVIIAAYHYFRIFSSWSHAYVLNGAVYEPTGENFQDAYRYVDWLLTVPLLLVEAISVLNLPKEQAKSLTARLVIAAALMIGLGYPGEISASFGVRFGWGFASTIPFVYILWVLWGELGEVIKRQTDEVRILVRNLRLLLLGTWGVYPIAYMLPFFGLNGPEAVMGVQLGYTIADVLAKPGFGLLIFAIAVAKTRNDKVGQAVPAPAGD